MIILGHRGYSAKYPENTIISFKKAMEAGADGVELDVWLSADGEVVVHHDSTLEKTFGVNKKIKESNLEELRNYEFRGEVIPTLGEVYDSLPDDAIINVEIKDIDVSIPALKVVKERNALDRTIFSSFDDKSLRIIKEEDKRAKIALLIGKQYKFYQFIKLVRDLNPDFLNPPILGERVTGRRTYKMYLRFMRWMGKPLIMWTVNNLDEFKPYYKFCYGVITDEVEKMVYYVKKREGK